MAVGTLSISLLMLINAQIADPPHVCSGDYVYKAKADEVSFGVRVRSDPDVFEVLFADYGNIESTQIDWRDGSLVAIDKEDKSSVVLVCSKESTTLVLPSDEYTPARTFLLRRVEGSLWEVGKREGWLEPGE
jgi:hypothetical protein